MDLREDAQEQQAADLLSRELMLSSMVHEVARVMHSATTLNQALASLLLGISELTGVQAMVLFLIREGQATLDGIHSLGVPARDLADLKLTLAHDSVYSCLASHRHILVDSVSAEDPLAGLGSRSYLLLPLSARTAGPAPGEASAEGGFRIHPIGVLWLDTTPPCPPLTAQLVSHLSGLCQQAGSLLETHRVQKELALANAELKAGHARLSEAYLALSRAQKRIEEDLDRARAIQNSLLPAAFPARGLRRAASRYIPAGKVGGDYYDCFELEPGVLGMVVADVSGHGIAAALVMSMFKALLRNFATLDRSPAAALRRINRTFLGQFGGAHFVTAWYGIFEQETRRLTWCNAGHVPQYLLQYPPAPAAGAAAAGTAGDDDGSHVLLRPALEELPSQGLVLGIFPDTFIKDASVVLAPEARLFLYSDGITEAHGEGGRMFGAEPLMDLALDLRDEHPAAVIDELMKVREAFLARAPAHPGGRAAEDLSDDATFVILDL